MTSTELRRTINDFRTLINNAALTPAQRVELLLKVNRLIDDADRQVVSIGEKLNNDLLPTLDREFHTIGAAFERRSRDVTQELNKLIVVIKIAVGLSASTYVFIKMWKLFH